MNMRIATRAGLAALVFSASTAIAQDSASVEAGPDGFALHSADGEWELQLRGLVHFDGRWFFDDSAIPGESRDQRGYRTLGRAPTGRDLR